MAFVIRFAKAVRNNWKKSTVFASALAYGVSYSNEKYEIKQLMRYYCTEASRYGDVKIGLNQRPPKVLVLLNPAANRKSSEEDFHEYCEPILHLAGFEVDVVKTDSEGHARRYVEELANLPDALIVGGGDGTLSEAVSGMKRRQDGAQCPIGVLPLGRTNTLAMKLFWAEGANNSDLEKVRTMANAAYAVIAGKKEKTDVMRIEVLPSVADETPPEKPVYAVGALQWGAFRDILALRDKYWYTASLRDYTAFLFNAFDGAHTWNCKAKIAYTEPCSGCSNCYKDMDDQWAAAKRQEQQPRRWWSVFVPRSKTVPKTDYTKIINDRCSVRHELEVDPSELVIKTGNVAVEEKENEKGEGSTKLEVLVGEQADSSFNFIGESWGRVKSRKFFEYPAKDSISVRTVELLPERLKVEESDPELYYSIDNEAYEVRPVRITLVPKAVEIFTF
ncbi:acylglycerol kinase, mitochondrial [Anopheles maculipalpis]|uniref:acylglycerol kinase, mitochondrial n=1 Tax=Anopheles maculipalpis TaxID=1496333 RepID=UPI002159125B|nr:acylglycerol kinase, mitochondrial [Anopheles maculipalpis]